jgi:hypothetical protein
MAYGKGQIGRAKHRWRDTFEVSQKKYSVKVWVVFI